MSRWGVVIPFFNEERFLGRTLETLLRQSVVPAQIILVDNGSTDRSRDIAEHFVAARPDVDIAVLSESTPGKVAALARGFAAVDAEFVAFCDADTLYPADYLARAELLLREKRAVAALAFGVYEGAPAPQAAIIRAKSRFASLLMPRQAHSGGYGQAFRTHALRQAGGYSRERWPYMVADHEIIHRLQKHGPIAYSVRHFCTTSPRRRSRRRVDWSIVEKLLYHVTPNTRKDWFFYAFLAGRFRKRNMFNVNLRERDWEGCGG